MDKIKNKYNCEKIREDENSSSLVKWYNNVIEKTYSELNVGDVLRMLRQNLFVDMAVKKSLVMLNNDIFIGEYYDGELLEHILKTDKNYLKDNIDDINLICEKVIALCKTINDESKNEILTAIENFKQ